jgi:WD40 repeat protein
MWVAAAADKPAAKFTPIPVAELKRTEPVSYEKDVQPLFAAKCTVCHSGTELQGKFDMGTFAALMKGGKKGVAVVPGKPDESPLWLRSSHRMGPIMPPKNEDNPLTSQEVAVLKLWIEQGAKGPAVDVRAKPKVVLGFPPALVKPVRAVAIAGAKDAVVVAAGRGNRVLLFDGKTGEFRKALTDPDLKTADGKPADAAHMSLVEAIAFSPDGKTLATGSFQELVLWDVETGKIRQRVGGFADRVVAIAYSPDGKLIATGGGAPTEDGEIKLFDAAGKPVADFKAPHSDTVFGVAFSPDGKRLATGAADKFVKVFEVPSGKLLKSFEGHTNHVLDVGWTPDGTKLVSAGADNFVKVWDYEKGEKARDIQGFKQQITRLAFVGKTPKFLTAAGDATVKLVNPDNGGTEKSFAGSTDYVYAVSASEDGAVVAAGGEEGVVRLYNGASGQLVKALVPPGEEPTADPGKKDGAKEPKKK